MIYRFFWRKIVPAGALSALAYLFFDRWHNWFFGALALVLYFLYVSAKARAVLTDYFAFVKSWRTGLLAVFLSLTTLGWLLGIFIFFNYFNGLAVFLSFLANALIWSLAGVKNDKDDDKEIYDYDKEIIDEPPHEKISVLIYAGLVIYGFYLLVISKTGSVISSPWQTIDPRYVWVFLAATFLLGFMVLFSRVSLKVLLFFVVAHSFLLHSYLPLTHDLFYGADGWRHIGAESRLLAGGGLMIPAVTGEKSLIAKSNIGVLSYANFWGTNAALAKILQADLISLTKWLLPVVWSVIFTILLYEIGLTLGWSGRKSLFLAWAGMWPFALQAAGAFSLPVNWSFLIFVLFFLLLLKRANAPNNGQKNILLALGIGSALGYLLFFVLYWLSWGVMAAIKSGRKLIIIPGLIAASLVLPVLELAARFSVWDGGVNILAQAKQFAGNFFALYLAGGPRPHDIGGGNILFNQISASVFTPNFLTQWLWWLPAVVFVAVIIVVLGLKQNRKDLFYQCILTIFVILLINYFLSFYLLSGERLFSRRLDAALALLFLILFVYGLKGFLDKKRAAGLAVAVLSLAITASYTLGPDTQTVSVNELEAAKYIWSQEQGSNTHCVLADVYPLLALEAVSGKEVIGGGFPIDASFAQPERVELYKQMNLAINDNVLRTTAVLTQTDHCWFVGDTDNFSKQGILRGGDYKQSLKLRQGSKEENAFSSLLTPSNYKVFGDAAAVRYNTKY